MLPSKLTYSQMGDVTLFLLIKQSNVKTFEEVYNRYWPALVNAAYKKLHAKEKAEDIAQAIFIDLYNRRSTIDLTTSKPDGKSVKPGYFSWIEYCHQYCGKAYYQGIKINQVPHCNLVAPYPYDRCPE